MPSAGTGAAPSLDSDSILYLSISYVLRQLSCFMEHLLFSIKVVRLSMLPLSMFP
uniref:Uncharacterized protein n=1 Tax=Arundo donax TaxID=35708 RepID=A0A0A9CWP0_ARUDO